MDLVTNLLLVVVLIGLGPALGALLVALFELLMVVAALAAGLIWHLVFPRF